MNRVFRFAATALFALAAAAQQSDEPKAEPLTESITVTAQKREEKLQDVPVSVEVIPGRKLDDFGLFDMLDLSASIPNYTIQEGTESTAITMRGIGNAGGTNFGFESSVGTFLDGVYHGRDNQARMPLFDVQRVEVLRGPQSTLFGMNTVAGAISLVSRAPSTTFEGGVELSYDPRYDSNAATATIGGPLTSTLSGRLALLRTRNDGYFYNTDLHRDVNGFDDDAARLTLQWKPAPRWTATGKIEQSKRLQNGNGTQVIVPPSDPEIIARELAIDPRATFAADLKVSQGNEFRDLHANDSVLTVDYAFDRLSITSISAYSRFNGRTRLDVDMSPIDVSWLREHERFSQRSEELRATSDTGRAIEYIGGVYYQSSDLTHDRLLDFALGQFIPAFAGTPGADMQTYAGNFAQSYRTAAAFGQVTWNASDRLRITAGARDNHERKHANSYFDWMVPGTTDPHNALDPASPEFAAANFVFHDVFRIVRHTANGTYAHDSWLPDLKVQWIPSRRLMLYASRTEGEKSGGFSDRDNRNTNFSFDPEQSANYELGAKSASAIGMLDVTLFRTEFRNMQVSVFDLPNLVFIVDNAARALSQGIELDGQWRASRGVTLDTSIGWMQTAKFLEFLVPCVAGPSDPECIARTGGDVRDDGGHDLDVPHFSGTAGIAWHGALSSALELQAGAKVSHRGAAIDSVNRSGRLDAATFVNARIGVASHNGWSLSVAGTNLTDKRWIASRNAALFAGSEFGVVRRPRTISIHTGFRF